MAQETYIGRQGGDIEFADVVISGTLDLNGAADALVIDADADTTISAPTDDQIDIEISGADDFRFTANTFTALSGSTIATNTIAETTAASGVTVDGVLLKDGGAVFADGASIEVDTVNEATSAAGVTADGVLLKDSAVTASGGVTADLVGGIKETVVAVSADGAISIPSASRSYFITKAGVAAMTIADPTVTTHDGVRLTFIATTAQAHTLSNAAGSGFNDGGSGSDVGTFGGAKGDNIVVEAYQGKWYVVSKVNVTLG